MTDLLLKNVRPVGFDHGPERTDIRIGADGRIAAVGPDLTGGETVDLGGAYLSPGWVDLHTHIYHGATDISVRPERIGLASGVTTLVDAGSAGEANFPGFREFIAERAQERVFAFLNIGSIGLVACNRVSEIIDIRSIDIDRTLDCIEANRDLIRGVKIRASHVITGSWGITPVLLAKKVAKLAGLPLMIHVGEPPPLLEEVFPVLTEGDIVTHCFHGKRGANLLEDAELFEWARRMADKGIVMDVGHGAASFSFQVAAASIGRGLLPATISTDLHLRNVDGPVWDLATSMSKLMALGMPLDAVVRAVTVNALKALRLPAEGLLASGARADFTVFTLADRRMASADSRGTPLTLEQLILPSHTVMGRQLRPARTRCPDALHAAF